jgi:ABC-2 type transport system permease protein
VVAHVLRLRFALLFGALRGDAAQVARAVIQVLFVIGATAAACWALLSLRDATPDVALTVSVLGGSAVTLGFALSPLIGAGSDPLDPRRFAVLGVQPARLAAMLAVAGFVSVPIFAVAAMAVCLALVWAAFDAPAAATVFAVAVGTATCVLLSRVCLTLAAMFLKERQSRELTGVILLLIVVVVVPTGVFLSSLEWRGIVPPQLSEAVLFLALSPLGAAWALPGLLATGDPDAGLVALVAVATLVVLAGLWVLLVRRVLTTTERPIAVRERGGLGWFAVAPGTPAGAIAARSLLYWLNDRRYLVNVLVIPVAAAATTVPLLVAGVSPEIVALVPVPFAALFLGWLVHNDLAYDSTAVWMHFAAGVRGLSDRLGRLVPVLLIGVPALAVAIPIAVSLYGRWSILPAMIGVCASLFLSGLGLSSIASAAAPYAVSRPGDSPFRQPPRSSASGAISQGLVFFGVLVLTAPTLWWAWLTLQGDSDYSDVALWGGVGIGLGVLLMGIGIGAAIFDHRGGRLMEFAEST